MNSKYLFIGEDLELHKGEEAKALLASTNDKEFLEDGKGVVRVPKSRWQVAQTYERKTWLEASAHASDDRNDTHAREFDDYRVLAGTDYNRAIELGCGPFTNLRVMAQKLNIERCVLLDPLIDSYLKHRHCMYANGKVRTGESRLSRALGKWKIGRAIRRVVRTFWPENLEDGLKVERRVCSSIENMPNCGTFDLVVMINVIEHCFDVELIFEKVLRLCKPGAVFVFHDRMYNANEVIEGANTRFDAGHPLRVNRDIIIAFLRKNFTTVSEKEVDVVDSIGDIDLTERGMFFIGKCR